MDGQWGKSERPFTFVQCQSLQTEDFCSYHIIHSQCILVRCVGSVYSLLPSSYTNHTSLLTGGSTRNEVCELSYGKQKGYYWQIEKVCLLSSLFLPAFIFNTSLCTETGLLETNRQFGDRGTHPHLIYQPVTARNKQHRGSRPYDVLLESVRTRICRSWYAKVWRNLWNRMCLLGAWERSQLSRRRRPW